MRQKITLQRLESFLFSLADDLRAKMDASDLAKLLKKIPKANDYNLNISRYISTTKPEKKIELKKVNESLKGIQEDITKYTNEHNKFFKVRFR